MIRISNILLKSLLVFATFCTIACTSNFKDINTPPYDAVDLTPDDYNVRAALISLQGWVLSTDEHTFQFVNMMCGNSLGGYLTESKADWGEKISTYNAPADWTKPAFEEIISGVYIAYQELLSATEDEIPISIAKIIRVAALQPIADIYGPIPYSKVGQDGALNAPYDSVENVYKLMFEELTDAIDKLTARSTEALNPLSDKIYGGNLVQWIKFANSHKLRMAMRLVYVDEALAKNMAFEAINHPMGTLNENADNAQFVHPSDSNLYYKEMSKDGWGDYRVSAEIISYMMGYNDPRISLYFLPSTFGSADLPGGFYGLRRGLIGADSGRGVGYSNLKVDMSTPLVWMNAAEVAFLKAEVALRWADSGLDAKVWYEKGVSLSFSDWSASGVEDYLADDVSIPVEYTDPLMSYSTSLEEIPTIAYNVADEFEVNFERIITQKWLANWRCTGLEGWAEFRRTGYPRLLPVPNNQSGGIILEDEFPRRLPYPQSEFIQNAKNYNYAVSNLLKGPDNLATRIWWDNNANTK